MQVPHTARASIHDVVATRERSRIHRRTIPMPVRAAIVFNCTDRIVSGRSAFAHHMYEVEPRKVDENAMDGVRGHRKRYQHM